jgi:plastocyanin
MKRLLPLLPVGVLLAGLIAFPMAGAARTHSSPPPYTPATATVLVGLGQSDVSQGAGLIFAPKYLDITVGDTVVFRDVDALEPHTVTFGPMAMLKQIANNPFRPVAQKAGPPLLTINPKWLLPTAGHTYDGTGFASSGFMRVATPPYARSWSLTFTRPGTYHYICLVHGVVMSGVVIVHAQPPRSKLYRVQAGDGLAAYSDTTNQTAQDAFYPKRLTIHVGDTVEWAGAFHTVTFGPVASIDRLEKHVFMQVPQKSGPPLNVWNPQVAFPSGGATYAGTGFVSSGLLIPPQNAKAPPTYRLTFTRPGVYKYDCLLHPGMDGSITVLPVGA